MVADRDPLDRRCGAGIAATQLEQAEIRGAAADVDNQHVMDLGIGIGQPAPQVPGRAVLLQPAVEGGLRLLEQPHRRREPSLLCRLQGQPLGGGVERRRDGDGDLLGIEPKLGAGPGEPVVPRPAQRVEDQRRRPDRRDLAVVADILRPPRQKRRRPVGGMMAKPRLGRMGHPPRHLRRLPPRQPPDHPLPAATSLAPQLPGHPVFRQIQKRRQRNRLRHPTHRLPLRNSEHLGRRVALQRHERHRRIGRAEIDTDAETGLGHGEIPGRGAPNRQQVAAGASTSDCRF